MRSTPTPRELEILALVADGLSRKQVARRLFISESTVQTHTEHARLKLGVPTTAAAIACVLRMGLIP